MQEGRRNQGTLIENSVEFSVSVFDTDVLKDRPQFRLRSQLQKVLFRDTQLRVVLREQNVDGFGLVAVVLIVSNRLFYFGRNVCPDRRTAKSTIRVLRPPDFVRAIIFDGFAQIVVGLKFKLRRLANQTLGSVPFGFVFQRWLPEHSYRLVGLIRILACAKIFAFAEVVRVTRRVIVNLLAYNDSAWVILVSPFRLNRFLAGFRVQLL